MRDFSDEMQFTLRISYPSVIIIDPIRTKIDPVGLIDVDHKLTELMSHRYFSLSVLWIADRAVGE